MTTDPNQARDGATTAPHRRIEELTAELAKSRAKYDRDISDKEIAHQADLVMLRAAREQSEKDARHYAERAEAWELGCNEAKSYWQQAEADCATQKALLAATEQQLEIKAALLDSERAAREQAERLLSVEQNAHAAWRTAAESWEITARQAEQWLRSMGDPSGISGDYGTVHATTAADRLAEEISSHPTLTLAVNSNPLVRIQWQCSSCAWGFFGLLQEQCPGCGAEGFWSGSVRPDCKPWPGYPCAPAPGARTAPIKDTLLEQAERERDAALARSYELAMGMRQIAVTLYAKDAALQAAETALASARELLAAWLGWRRGKVGREPLTTNTRTWLTSHPSPAPVAEEPCCGNSQRAYPCKNCPLLAPVAAPCAGCAAARTFIERFCTVLSHESDLALVIDAKRWLKEHP